MIERFSNGTGQQRMFTPPWHLILPRVHVLHSTLYFLFWIMITFNILLTSVFDILKYKIAKLTMCKTIHNSKGNYNIEWRVARTPTNASAAEE
jgi:hypothetical protein